MTTNPKCGIIGCTRPKTDWGAICEGCESAFGSLDCTALDGVEIGEIDRIILERRSEIEKADV